MKRFLSLFLSLVLILALLPLGAADAAISVSTYEAKVQEFLSKPRWANEASWGGGMTQSWEYSDWSSSGCCAYCADFAGYVYGSRRAWNSSDFTRVTDPAEIRTGDIVHYRYSNSKRTSQHWIVVLERDGDKLYTAEGNAYVDGKYSVVCVTDDKYAIVDGTMKNTWNKTEKLYDFEIFHYNFSDELPCPHAAVKVEGAAQATCSEEGYTGDTLCAACGEVLEYGLPVPALGHSWSGDTCLTCGGKASDVYRLAGGNRFQTAFAAADAMKEELGVEKFQAIIVASGTGFADALAGSYLSSAKNAPILLSFDAAINAQVAEYIQKNLDPSGIVYILGGPGAVSETMETALSDFCVMRLAGNDRFGTNLAILAEAGVGDKPILVCTGLSFADSLSASAAKLPILLVWNRLTDDQKAFLEASGSDIFYIIGGESAVSAGMELELSAYGVTDRLGGSNRFETSVLIAEEFFDAPGAAVLAYAWNFPDGLCGGALAAAMNAPLILTMDKYEAQAAQYVQSKSLTQGYVLGSNALVSDKTVKTIFGMTEEVTNK